VFLHLLKPSTGITCFILLILLGGFVTRCNHLLQLYLIDLAVRLYINVLFSGCKQIVDVYCNAVFAPTTGTDAFETVTQLSATLHVPESSIGGYKNSSPWGKFIKIVAIE